MTTAQEELDGLNAAWLALTRHERLWLSEHGPRMERLYLLHDEAVAHARFAFSLDASD